MTAEARTAAALSVLGLRVARCPSGKHRHASREDASGELAKLGARERDARRLRGLSVYACSACGGWHFGHRRRG